MALIRVWLSHDGYRDPDDNLSLLLGAAQARTAAQSSPNVRVGGILFGDTKDGGQYYTLNPAGTAPSAFGTDSRYGDVAGNRQASGNYAFFQDYGQAALKALGPGWKTYDLLATDNGGLRAWNFDATAKTQISAGSQALAADIIDAITQTGAATAPAKIVVYSAGGGANVAAEAIGYLQNRGYAEADLLKHFVVVQHGNNWVTNYEDAARELTRDFTIAISNQNYASYANGNGGPNLKHALSGAVTGDTVFADAFDTALAVATGGRAYEGLPAKARFKATLDASDAGSHAFAVDAGTLTAAMAHRLSGNEGLQTSYDWAHLIDTGAGSRLREIFSDFDPATISSLLWGGAKSSAKASTEAVATTATAAPLVTTSAMLSSASSAEEGTGKLVLAIAAGADDRESLGGSGSDDLDLGIARTAAGERANVVTLHFDDLKAGPETDSEAEIASAYLLFEAKRASTAEGSLTIAAEGESVTWDDPGAWTAGKNYSSTDVQALVAAALDAGSDGIDFTLTGTGSRVAEAFESDGTAPQLVIAWDLG
jgi:hypothetical protein